jgi:hypothetical protein
MKSRENDYEAVVAAMEPLLGVKLEDAWRPKIAGFVAMAAQAADLFADLPLDEAVDEQAPVFRPGHLP